MMLCMLAMRNKGLKIAESEGEMQGLERNQKRRKTQGQNAKEPENGNEKKLFEIMGSEEKLGKGV